MKKMKRILLLLFICFLFTPFTAIQSYAEEQEQKKENILLQEGFKEEISAKQKKRLGDGYGVIYTEKFNSTRTVSLSAENEEKLIKKGYDLGEFKQRQIPRVWSIDFSTIPSDALFQNVEGGFKIISNQGLLRLICKLNGDIGELITFFLPIQVPSRTGALVILQKIRYTDVCVVTACNPCL